MQAGHERSRAALSEERDERFWMEGCRDGESLQVMRGGRMERHGLGKVSDG